MSSLCPPERETNVISVATLVGSLQVLGSAYPRAQLMALFHNILFLEIRAYYKCYNGFAPGSCKYFEVGCNCLYYLPPKP